MNFKGKAKRIEDIDLPRIGAMIGVGEDEIHAVIDVEAAGSGFDSQGRLKMRGEYQYFYKFLPGDKLQKAIDQGLAFKSWRSGKHPKDMYPILARMMKIDAHAALLSCSWGMGQIMGFNHIDAGYDTVEDMVKDFCDDEDNQLEGMIKFIKNNHLDDELRNHNWSGFARGYNGSQYAKHGYHVKLEKAYNKWAKIKDTPYKPETTHEAAKQDAPAPLYPIALVSAVMALMASWWEQLKSWIMELLQWIF